MHKNILLAFFLAASVSFSQEQPKCPIGGEGVISAIGYGETRLQAEQDADRRIAENISSTLKSASKDSLSIIEISGSIKDESIFKQIVNVNSDILNKQDIHPFKEPYYDKERNEWISERYMCNSDAARPWLFSFGSKVDRYSTFAIKIAKENDSQERNKLLDSAESVKDSTFWANIIVLNSIIRSGVSPQMNQEYSNVKEKFKTAAEKIELALKKKCDTGYRLMDDKVMLLVPWVPFGTSQFYKGRWDFGLLSGGLQAAGLGLGYYFWINYKDNDRKYKDAVLKYNGSSNINEKNELLQKSKGYKSDRESAETNFKLFLGLAALGYAFSLADGYFIWLEPTRKQCYFAKNF